MAGCDEGTPTLSDAGAGPAPNVVWWSPGDNETNVGLRQSIRVQFDRYLLPDSAVRQGICVQSMTPDSTTNNCPNGVLLAPQYDPVDRVVAWIPQQDLTANTRYAVRVLAPRSDEDLTGIRAFDGVPLAAEKVFEFTTGSSMTPTIPEPVRDVDFCYAPKDLCTLPDTVCSPVFPLGSTTGGTNLIVHTSCAVAGSACHASPLPAPSLTAGSALLLSNEQGIPAAIHQLVTDQVVATETATAPNPGAAALSGVPFGQNMPYIDPKSAGNSFLLYKVILATPAPAVFRDDMYSCSALEAAGLMTLDGSTCTSMAPLSMIPPVAVAKGQVAADPVDSWVPEGKSVSAAPREEERLRFRIRGEPMPFTGYTKLSSGQVRTLSAWIAQGAPTSNCTP